MWAPREEGQFQPGFASRWWLHHSLRELGKQVECRGNFICFRKGPSAVEQLLGICREASASVVFFNNVYDPLSLVRDHEVKRRLSAAGIVARSFNGELLFEPWAVLDQKGLPLTTFQSFWDKYVSLHWSWYLAYGIHSSPSATTAPTHHNDSNPHCVSAGQRTYPSFRQLSQTLLNLRPYRQCPMCHHYVASLWTTCS